MKNSLQHMALHKVQQCTILEFHYTTRRPADNKCGHAAYAWLSKQAADQQAASTKEAKDQGQHAMIDMGSLVRKSTADVQIQIHSWTSAVTHTHHTLSYTRAELVITMHFC